jgi:hypothetical protein
VTVKQARQNSSIESRRAIWASVVAQLLTKSVNTGPDTRAGEETAAVARPKEVARVG